MTETPSKLSDSRQAGKFQTSTQHGAILDAAEALFCERGLEAVKMTEIAERAGITKITLYRYFSNRDEIALEIQARMMNRIAQCIPPDALVHSPANAKIAVRALIRNFEKLTDAYRFVGLFYLSGAGMPPDEKRMRWSKENLPPRLSYNILSSARPEDIPLTHRINTLLSMTIWTLENLALRGDLVWNEAGLSLQEHLQTIEEIMMVYIEQLAPPSAQ